MIREKKLFLFVTTRNCECTGHNHKIIVNTEGKLQLKMNTDCMIIGNILSNKTYYVPDTATVCNVCTS